MQGDMIIHHDFFELPFHCKVSMNNESPHMIWGVLRLEFL
jgi:hypothetical protein